MEIETLDSAAVSLYVMSDRVSYEKGIANARMFPNDTFVWVSFVQCALSRFTRDFKVKAVVELRDVGVTADDLRQGFLELVKEVDSQVAYPQVSL